jgi:hypothetical protein
MLIAGRGAGWVGVVGCVRKKRAAAGSCTSLEQKWERRQRPRLLGAGGARPGASRKCLGPSRRRLPMHAGGRGGRGKAPLVIFTASESRIHHECMMTQQNEIRRLQGDWRQRARYPQGLGGPLPDGIPPAAGGRQRVGAPPPALDAAATEVVILPAARSSLPRRLAPERNTVHAARRPQCDAPRCRSRVTARRRPLRRL